MIIIKQSFKFLKINVELQSKTPILRSLIFQVFVILHLILYSLPHASNNLSLKTLHCRSLNQSSKDIMAQFSHMVKLVQVRPIRCKVDKGIREVQFHVLFITFFKQSKVRHIRKNISSEQHFYNCTTNNLLTF